MVKFIVLISINRVNNRTSKNRQIKNNIKSSGIKSIIKLLVHKSLGIILLVSLKIIQSCTNNLTII